MAKIDEMVKDFLAQKKIALVGVSERRETGCNMSYRKFKKAGYQVFAVNPHIETFDGDPCYPDLKSLPEKPDAVFILARPQVSEQVVQQCVDDLPFARKGRRDLEVIPALDQQNARIRLK